MRERETARLLLKEIFPSVGFKGEDDKMIVWCDYSLPDMTLTLGVEFKRDAVINEVEVPEGIAVGTLLDKVVPALSFIVNPKLSQLYGIFFKGIAKEDIMEKAREGKFIFYRSINDKHESYLLDVSGKEKVFYLGRIEETEEGRRFVFFPILKVLKGRGKKEKTDKILTSNWFFQLFPIFRISQL